MDQGQDPPGGITELETETDIDEDADPGEKDCQEGLFRQILAHLGPHHFHPPHLDGVLSEGIIQLFFHFSRQALEIRSAFPYADNDLLGTELLDDAVFYAEGLEGLSYLVDGEGDVEFDLDEGAPGEVDAVIESPMPGNRGKGDDDHGHGDAAGQFHFTDKVDVDVRFDKFHECHE